MTVLSDVRATTIVVPMREAVSISMRAVPARAYTLVRLGFEFVDEAIERFSIDGRAQG